MDPFARQAKEYLLHRPRYPSAILSTLRFFLSLSHNNINNNNINNNNNDGKNGIVGGVCIDAACGSGQATFALSNELGFERVIGVDISSAQLEQITNSDLIDGNKNENIKENHDAGVSIGNDESKGKVSFVHGDAHNLEDIEDISESSVDCVVAAQAAHWFDLPRFFSSAERVLKPRGVLAIMGYSVPTLSHDDPVIQKRARDIFEEYYKGFRDLWDPRCNRDLLDKAFRGVEEPFDGPKGIDSIHFVHHETRANTSVDDFGAYLRTWSAYQNVDIEKDGDPAAKVCERLRDLSPEFGFTIPFFLVTWRKP